MANLVRFDPFEELRALQRQFFGDDGFGSTSSGMGLPTTDVYTEDNKRLVVEAHLPHFDQDDVNISVHDGVLEIQAEKREKEEDKDRKRYVVRESSSSFYRRIRLPEVADEDSIDAHMDNGVLKVVVPFKELPAPKKIAIKAKSGKK